MSKSEIDRNIGSQQFVEVFFFFINFICFKRVAIVSFKHDGSVKVWILFYFWKPYKAQVLACLRPLYRQPR